MRLRIQIVYKKNRKIDFLSNDERRDFRIPAHRSRMHTRYIACDAVMYKGFPYERARRSRTKKFVHRKHFGIVQRPVDDVGFAVIVRYERDP